MFTIPTLLPTLGSAPHIGEESVRDSQADGSHLSEIQVGMTREQVERIMHKKRYSSILSGGICFTWYPESKLSVFYTDGKVNAVTRR